MALQPLRARFDVDRVPGTSLSPADIRANVASVLREPALRAMCLAMFSFVGLQSLFTGFFVLYLVRGLGYDLERAGLVFAIAVAVAVPARIGWGWLAARLVRPATLLSLLGIGMAVSAVLAAVIHPAWPTWLATLVAILFSATAVSWHGVLLAEVARLSPPGRIGATTGAVLAFGDAGALVLPLLFSARADADGRLRAGLPDRRRVRAGGRPVGRVASGEPARLMRSHASLPSRSREASVQRDGGLPLPSPRLSGGEDRGGARKASPAPRRRGAGRGRIEALGEGVARRLELHQPVGRPLRQAS